MISWQDLGAALALLLIFEGLMPFFNPSRFRQVVETLKQLDDGQLRSFGLGLILVGFIILFFVRF